MCYLSVLEPRNPKLVSLSYNRGTSRTIFLLVDLEENDFLFWRRFWKLFTCLLPSVSNEPFLDWATLQIFCLPLPLGWPYDYRVGRVISYQTSNLKLPLPFDITYSQSWVLQEFPAHQNNHCHHIQTPILFLPPQLAIITTTPTGPSISLLLPMQMPAQSSFSHPVTFWSVPIPHRQGHLEGLEKGRDLDWLAHFNHQYLHRDTLNKYPQNRRMSCSCTWVLVGIDLGGIPGGEASYLRSDGRGKANEDIKGW